VLDDKTLRVFDDDGNLVKTANLLALGLEDAKLLAFEPHTQSLWVTHKKGISRIATDVGISLAATLNTADEEEIKAVGTSPFIVTPTLSLVSPADNALTNNPRPAFTFGFDALCMGLPCGFAPDYSGGYSLSALLNNVQVGDGFVFDTSNGQTRYTPPYNLLEGSNSLSAQAKDSFGHYSNNIISSFTIDTIAPRLSEITPADNAILANAKATIEGKVDDPAAMVLVGKTGATATPATTTVNAGVTVFRITVTLKEGINTYTLTALDRAGNSSSQTLRLNYNPGPALNPSAVNPTTASILANTTAFLYSGTNPVQTGVAAGTIEAKRAAVLRGKVMTRDNQPLRDAKITVQYHPEFGQTLTRNDGIFDMAVNGGGVLTINYEKPGYLPVQRQVHTPWQDFAIAPDVVMIALDAKVTTIAANAATIQVAQGNPVTDSDGTRKAVMMFAPGTAASMILPNGGTQSLATLNVRATEYTVGPDGPKAMPGPLPPTSGYTYAVELSADEAIAAGAKEVRFSQPVMVYVENFLNFPVGGIVPAGYYDRDKAAWIPAPNGRVVKLLAIVNALAELDADGDGLADNAAQLAALNISDAERQQLAALYQSGVSLWRVPVSHFTPWDYNWPYGPPPDATPPNQPPPDTEQQEDEPTTGCGSIIECQNQTLGERLPITGTPFSLNFRSDRVPGRKTANTVNIRLSSASVPSSLKRIELGISVAGRWFTQTFSAALNQRTTFEWDGKDAYGRTLQGSQNVSIGIGYVYGAVYQQPAQFAQSFSVASGAPISGNRARQEITLWQETHTVIGSPDARSSGLGGWSADIHHSYDTNRSTLYLGDGSKRSARELNQGIISTVTGNGIAGFSGDGGAATAASLANPYGLAVDAQGNLFIGDVGNHRIRKVSADGIVSTVAGNGVSGFSGDGGAATAAHLNVPFSVAVDALGNLFFADSHNHRIRKVGADGIISTVAGNGVGGFSGDGGAATAARLNQPYSVAVDARGNLLIADTHNHRIRKVGADGIISTVAGSGVEGFRGDGGAVTDARLAYPSGVAVDAQGNLFVGDSNNSRIRKVRADGIISTVAGNGIPGFDGDGGAATAARLNVPHSVAVDVQGNLFIGDVGNNRIRKVALPFPSFNGADLLITSADGTELYHFDPTGRHLRTLNAKIQAVIYTFGYDTKGYLTQITDGDGNKTLIERDDAGRPAAIVSADNRRTTITVDANGYLASITNPAGESHRMTYAADGLLTRFADPNGNASTMTYDALGRLVRDQNAAGGFWALSRGESSNGYEASMSSAENRTTTYRVENLATGDKRRTNLHPDGTRTITLTQTNGTITDTAADGTVTTAIEGPDPRFGMQAPITRSLSIKTPGGRTLTATTTRAASLTNPINPLSLVSETTQATVNGKTSTTLYDAALRQYTLTSPANRRSLTRTDTLGRPDYQQFAALEPLSYQYDARGRLVSVTQGTGTVARTAALTYNAQGQLASITDPLGRTTLYQYDLAGRVTQQTLPDNRTIGYSYDANGNVTAITPPGRPNHAFSYTPVDLEQQYTPPSLLPLPPAGEGGGEGSTSYAYNLDKQITTITRPDGQLINFTYDAGGRLSSLTAPTGATSYAYDAAGRLQSLNTTAGANLSYTYDGALPLTETISGTIAGSVARSYNNDFRPASLSVNGAAVPFSYDADGLLTRAGSLSLTRDPASGFLTATTLGNVSTSQSYTPFGELQTLAATVAGSAAYRSDFVYDKSSRVIEKSETLQGQTQSDRYAYSYDAVGRLVAVSKNGASVSSYSYDANGNRTSSSNSGGNVTATYDQQDRLTSHGNTAYTHTANGEFKSKTDGAGQVTSFSYDVFGNLKLVTLPDNTQIEYLTDGRNRRIGKKINGTLTQGFLYQDQLKPAAELDAGGAVVSRFVYATKANVPEYMEKGGIQYRIVADHLGSVRLVINTASGAIAQRMDYDEFGNVTQDTNPGFQPFGFAGGLYDRHTKLTRFGARDYDAETGKWTAKDPIRFAGGDTNLSAYVGNDPVNFTDTMGFAPAWVGIAAPVIGATGGTLVAIGIATGNPVTGGIGVGLAVIGGGLQIWDLTSPVEQIEAIKNGEDLKQIIENNQKIQDMINKERNQNKNGACPVPTKK